MEILIPSHEAITLLHDTVIQFSGGEKGILHQSTVEAFPHRPQTYMGYNDDCDIHTVCAILLDSISRNHGYRDGNKRTALVTVLFTYTVNGVYHHMNLFMNEDYEKLVLWVVLEKPSIQEIASKLKELADKYQKKGFEVVIARLKKAFFGIAS